jgi:flagellar basal body-associated protein FliL
MIVIMTLRVDKYRQTHPHIVVIIIIIILIVILVVAGAIMIMRPPPTAVMAPVQHRTPVRVHLQPVLVKCRSDEPSYFTLYQSI